MTVKKLREQIMGEIPKKNEKQGDRKHTQSRIMDMY